MPVVFLSTTPAELILIDGQPKFQEIPNTQLMYVTNTEGDLLFHKVEANYYFLVSGRWFRANSPAGPWTYATPDLPADFASIPSDHVLAHTLSAVPGTPEANQAVQQAQVPQQATVNRDEASVEVTYNGEPEFKEVEGTEMTYAVNSSYDVIYVSSSYYCCYQGVWFISSTPSGGYIVCHNVPTVIYAVPASCPVHHVTYVRVYSSTSTTVVFGYSSGYMGCYVYNGVVVYGSGYYYPPYVYYGPVYPVYHPYPHSYGVHAYYNPHTGTYARGSSVYGPYGGAGRAAAYNPSTGTYARGRAAYGPYGGSAAMSAYNPRTGARGASCQSYNQYAHWGETVVGRGDKWAHSGHYTDAQGTRAGFETSEGARGVGFAGDDHRGGVVKSRDDDLYVGKDGNVYKRDGDGWQKNQNGEWNTVEPSQDLSERASTRKEAQEQRGRDPQSDRGANITDEQRATAKERAGTRESTGKASDRQGTTDRNDRDKDQSQRQTGERSSGKDRQLGSTQSRTGRQDGVQKKRSGNTRDLNRDAMKRNKGNKRSKDYSSYR